MAKLAARSAADHSPRRIEERVAGSNPVLQPPAPQLVFCAVVEEVVDQVLAREGAFDRRVEGVSGEPVDEEDDRLGEGDQPTHCLVVLERDQPIGWCQWHPCADYPEHAAGVGADPGDDFRRAAYASQPMNEWKSPSGSGNFGMKGANV